jgi:hypothetical protein
VVAELLRHPAGAAMDAKLPQGPVGCFGGHVGGGESDGCSGEANSTSHHASFTLICTLAGRFVAAGTKGSGSSGRSTGISGLVILLMVWVPFISTGVCVGLM